MASHTLPRFMSSTEASRAAHKDKFHAVFSPPETKSTVMKSRGRSLMESANRRIASLALPKMRKALTAPKSRNPRSPLFNKSDLKISPPKPTLSSSPTVPDSPARQTLASQLVDVEHPSQDSVTYAPSITLSPRKPSFNDTKQSLKEPPSPETPENQSSSTPETCQIHLNNSESDHKQISLWHRSSSLIPVPARAKQDTSLHQPMVTSCAKSGTHGEPDQTSRRKHTPSLLRSGVPVRCNSYGAKSSFLPVPSRIPRYPSADDILTISKNNDRIAPAVRFTASIDPLQTSDDLDVSTKRKRCFSPHNSALSPTDSLGSDKSFLCSNDEALNPTVCPSLSTIQNSTVPAGTETSKFSDTSSSNAASSGGSTVSEAHTIYGEDEHGGYRDKPLSRSNLKVAGRLRIRNSAADVLTGGGQTSNMQTSSSLYLERPTQLYKRNILRKWPRILSYAPNEKQETRSLGEGLNQVEYQESRPLWLNPNRLPVHEHRLRERKSAITEIKISLGTTSDTNSTPNSESPWPLSASSTEPFPPYEDELIATERCDVNGDRDIMCSTEMSPQCSVKSEYSLKSALNLLEDDYEIRKAKSIKTVRFEGVTEKCFTPQRGLNNANARGTSLNTTNTAFTRSRSAFRNAGTSTSLNLSEPSLYSDLSANAMRKMSSSNSANYPADPNRSRIPVSNTGKRIIATKLRDLLPSNPKKRASTTEGRIHHPVSLKPMLTRTEHEIQKTSRQRHQQAIFTDADYTDDYLGAFTDHVQEPREIQKASNLAHKLLDKASAEPNTRKKGELLELAATLVEICGLARDAEKAKEEAVAAASRAQISCVDIRKEVRSATAAARAV